MYEVDAIDLLARDLLRERAAELVAEACAWSVGLSDRPYCVRRTGRVAESGLTLGMRAQHGQQLGADEDGRLDLADALPGSFGDALNALTPGGKLYVEGFDEQVLAPFVLDTCVRAAERAQEVEPQAWSDLLDDLGEDDPELVEVVRVAEWEAPLRLEAELLVLAALGDVPLVEVEAEGLPLSLVRAAEAELRDAVGVDAPAGPADEELAGALFLADAALRSSDLTVPVPPTQAPVLLEVLLAAGIEPVEVLSLLPHLPVHQDTADQVAARVETLRHGG